MAARPVKTVQVLDRFRGRFIDEMDANSVVHDLFHNKITSDGDYQDITTTRGRNQQNRFLHLSLKKCTDEVFRKACKIFIKSGEHGNSRMKALGEEMLAAMNEAKKQSLVTAAATTAQFPLTSSTQTTASAILTQLVYDHPDHLILFRDYVSRKAAGKVKTVLEGLRLDSSTIRACITSNPYDDEGAAQAGLTKWAEGQGRQPPSWALLIEAMKHAQIAQQHVQGLKKKLGLSTGPGNDVLESDVSGGESSPRTSSDPPALSVRKRLTSRKPLQPTEVAPKLMKKHSQTTKCSTKCVCDWLPVAIGLCLVVGGVFWIYSSLAHGQSPSNPEEAELSAGGKHVPQQDGQSHSDSKKCLHGFPAAWPPDDFKSKKSLPSGDYLFPDVTIQCSGNITAVRFAGYFNPGVLYNNMLSMRLVFYTQSGLHYKPLSDSGHDRNLDLSLVNLSQKYPRLQADVNGKYHVSNPFTPELSSVLKIPLRVFPGSILGISIPTNDGVNIVALEVFGRQTLRVENCTTNSCDTLPVQGILPMVQLEFTAEGGSAPGRR